MFDPGKMVNDGRGVFLLDRARHSEATKPFAAEADPSDHIDQGRWFQLHLELLQALPLLYELWHLRLVCQGQIGQGHCSQTRTAANYAITSRLTHRDGAFQTITQLIGSKNQVLQGSSKNRELELNDSPATSRDR